MYINNNVQADPELLKLLQSAFQTDREVETGVKSVIERTIKRILPEEELQLLKNVRVYLNENELNIDVTFEENAYIMAALYDGSIQEKINEKTLKQGWRYAKDLNLNNYFRRYNLNYLKVNIVIGG